MNVSWTGSWMQSALSLLDRADARLLAAVQGLSSGDGDLVEGFADLSRARFEARLGATMVRVGNETLGSLLDLVV